MCSIMDDGAQLTSRGPDSGAIAMELATWAKDLVEGLMYL